MIDYLEKIYKLKDVIRYNTRQKLKDESVAEHSFFVALIGLDICDKYQLNDDIKLKVLIKALLHDMPEIELNDITHDVKEKLKLRPLLKKYEDEYYKNNFEKYFDLMTKNNDIIDQIVEIADTMSVIQYTNNEIKLGNKSNEMKEIYENTKYRLAEYIKELEKKLW